MPRIGPDPSRGGGGGDRPPAVVLPPGPEVVALVWFKRKTSENSGRDYLNALFEICGGPHKGKSFFTVVSLNLDSPGSVTRWQVWIGALEIRETFELGDTSEGTDRTGDANISRLFKGKPFACELEVETGTDGQKRQNIKSVIFRSKWTDEQKAIARAYIEGRAASSPEDTAGDVPRDEHSQRHPPDDDFGPTNYDDVPQTRSRGGAPEDDDDIPF